MSKSIRCANGDWEAEERGRFSYIGDGIEGSDGREKCAQDVACTLLQDEYDDGSWGSKLGQVEKGRIVDSIAAHKGLINNMVQESLDHLVELQAEEEAIPDTERIGEYQVFVDRLQHMALSYMFYVKIETAAGQQVEGEPYLVQLEHRRDPAVLTED